jgi:beta-1,4-mannosyl-glycoprotein beta-1,4-N-acetylglucosaminyltransferase
MKKLLLTASFLSLALLLWTFSQKATPKVYDCFLFYNELELLDIRLHEMAPYVDHFVIVEAKETFRGRKKPLYFAENAHRFKPFEDKIIHVVIEDLQQTDDPWDREHYQREQIMRGLKGCHAKDIILISDVDEIVKGSRIPELVGQISSGRVQALVCEQKMYFGFLNRYQSLWTGTVCMPYQKLREISILKARRLRNQKASKLRKARIERMLKVEDAGWHFTSMGGQEKWELKMQSYSHSEKSAKEGWKEEYFNTVSSASTVPVDGSFPQYVLDNQEHFRQIHFIE